MTSHHRICLLSGYSSAVNKETMKENTGRIFILYLLIPGNILHFIILQLKKCIVGWGGGALGNQELNQVNSRTFKFQMGFKCFTTQKS